VMLASCGGGGAVRLTPPTGAAIIPGQIATARLTKVAWQQVPGWEDDSLIGAAAALRQNCVRLAGQSNWQRACAAAAQLDDLDVALLGIRDVSSSRLGHVTIACVPSVAYYFLPSVVANYHSRYPRIRVKLLDSGANEVLGAVTSGEADFGVSFMGSQETEVEFKVLLQERFVAACRRDHPLARKKRVSWSELYEHEYVSVDKTSGNRLLLDQALTAVAPRVPSVCETRHVTTMLGLVEAGRLGEAHRRQIAQLDPQQRFVPAAVLGQLVVRDQIGTLLRFGPTASDHDRHLIDAQ